MALRPVRAGGGPDGRRYRAADRAAHGRRGLCEGPQARAVRQGAQGIAKTGREDQQRTRADD